MGVAEAVVGLGQPVALHVADGRPSAVPWSDLAPDRERDLRGEAPIWSIGRPNMYFGRCGRRGGRRGRCARAVKLASTAMSIAELPMPSTTTRLVAEEARGRRPCSRASASARPRRPRRRGRRARASAGPSGGRWRRAARRSGASRRSSERDLPDAVGAPRGALDAGLEADAVAHAEVVDVVVEVLRDVGVVREVGIGLRHREVRVLHALARGVDVQRAVGGRHPVGVPPHPVAADAVGLLEAVTS